MANFDKVSNLVIYFLLFMALILLAMVSCVMMKTLLYCIVHLLQL